MYVLKGMHSERHRVETQQSFTKSKSKGEYVELVSDILKRYNGTNKGAWRMPGLSEAKKDVTSCEKLRRVANTP